MGASCVTMEVQLYHSRITFHRPCCQTGAISSTTWWNLECIWWLPRLCGFLNQCTVRCVGVGKCSHFRHLRITTRVKINLYSKQGPEIPARLSQMRGGGYCLHPFTCCNAAIGGSKLFCFGLDDCKRQPFGGRGPAGIDMAIVKTIKYIDNNIPDNYINL